MLRGPWLDLFAEVGAFLVGVGFRCIIYYGYYSYVTIMMEWNCHFLGVCSAAVLLARGCTVHPHSIPI